MAAEAFLFEIDPDSYKGNQAGVQEQKKKIRKAPIDDLISEVEHAIEKYKGNSL